VGELEPLDITGGANSSDEGEKVVNKFMKSIKSSIVRTAVSAELLVMLASDEASLRPRRPRRMERALNRPSPER
jgi:hypothetical protein